MDWWRYTNIAGLPQFNADLAAAKPLPEVRDEPDIGDEPEWISYLPPDRQAWYREWVEWVDRSRNTIWRCPRWGAGFRNVNMGTVQMDMFLATWGELRRLSDEVAYLSGREPD